MGDGEFTSSRLTAPGRLTARATAPGQRPDEGAESGYSLAEPGRRWEPQRPLLCSWIAGGIGLVIFALRRPSAFTDPGLYAEDGVIFMLESLRDGIAAIIEPYNGYLHVVPRLIAAIATGLPLRWTPSVFALMSAFVAVASCSVVLQRRFATLVPNYLWRVGLFGLLLLIPRMTEVHLALNSLLWWCGVALLLMSLGDDPRTGVGRSAELVVVPLLVISGLAGVVLAPLVALRWLRLRTRHSMWLVGVWWTTAAIQLAVYVTQDRQNGEVPVGAALVRAALEKTFGSVIMGQDNADSRWAAGMPWPVLIGVVVIAAAWAALVVTGNDWHRSASLLWAAAVSLVAGFLALGPAAAALPDRYTVLPIAAVLIGLVCSRPRTDLVRHLRFGALVLVLVIRVTDFGVPARPSTDWDGSMSCLDQVAEDCTVVLNPEGWTVLVPGGVR